MKNVELASTSTPTIGETIDVGKPVVKSIIERVLPGGTLVVRNGDDLFFVMLNERGYYQMTGEPWDNSEYEAMRRAELMPKVGSKVVLPVTTYVGSDGKGGEWADLVLKGIVKAVDSQGQCTIQVVPFELVADRDYWINIQKHDSVDDNLGLYQDGEQIN